jgi:hypothetical protein
MPKPLSIAGQRFGRLVALEPQGRAKNRGVLWFCRCDCANGHLVRRDSLVNGSIKSCGCLLREATGARSIARTTHGHARQGRTATYVSWRNMLARCYNPRHKDYKNYGGRGVGIDDPRWFSFQKILGDMGEKPPGCDLHRVNNDLGYSKANCVWLPHSEHMRLHLKERHARQRARLDLEPHALGCS